MKIGFQHMGNLHVALRAFVETLGVEVAQGPPPTRRTLEIGARHAPEMVCLPFKVTLGDMIACLERGADTLAFLGSGDWSCRFGYYGRTQCLILQKLGYTFRPLFISYQSARPAIAELIALHRGSRGETLLRALQAFALAWRKSRLVELTESSARALRPFEAERGIASRLERDFVRRIEAERSMRGLGRLRRRITDAFAGAPARREEDPLRVVIVGESYCVIEPLVNFDLIELLGAEGVLAEPFLTAHRWLFYHTIRKDEDPICRKKEAMRLARPFWAYNTGGEDQAALGYTIHAAGRGVDGAIHLLPFGCMPETAVWPVFDRVCQQLSLPLLHLSLDEQSGQAGIRTRVEAFLDLLRERRGRRRLAS